MNIAAQYSGLEAAEKRSQWLTDKMKVGLLEAPWPVVRMFVCTKTGRNICSLFSEWKTLGHSDRYLTRVPFRKKEDPPVKLHPMIEPRAGLLLWSNHDSGRLTRRLETLPPPP